jgi:SulP family sulfate permease
MATTIVDYCRTNQYDWDTLLATATICIPLATTLLGAGLILLGRWQLAQYVQLLPTCVVGGYLAYIGWFCGMAGVGLMAGGASQVTPSLVQSEWYHILPGILSGLLLYVCVRKLRHMAVLPCGILLLLCCFYLTLWWRGTSIARVTELGWIRRTNSLDDNGSQSTAFSWMDTWSLMKWNKVAWGVLPQLLLTELSMIFVVALSSSLDVAAIEIELQRPLDYNHELQTVGLSNLVSGLTGGYTGSYIFSQSIFSLRAGIRSSMAGYVLAATQLTVFLLPFPILSYVPNFFFGSLLSLICVDLVYEWLWEVRDKVSAVEYLVCLSTFGLIQVVGVEYGILLGVLLYLMLRKLGFDVGNKHDSNNGEDDTEDERDTLVVLSVRHEDYSHQPSSGSDGYGTLDVPSLS